MKHVGYINPFHYFFYILYIIFINLTYKKEEEEKKNRRRKLNNENIANESDFSMKTILSIILTDRQIFSISSTKIGVEKITR